MAEDLNRRPSLEIVQNHTLVSSRVLEAGALEQVCWDRFYMSAVAESKGRSTPNKIRIIHDEYLAASIILAHIKGDIEEEQRLVEWRIEDKRIFLEGYQRLFLRERR